MATKPIASNPVFTTSTPVSPSPTGSNVTNVKFVRKELEEVLPRYEKIRDVVKGQDAVKAKGTAYLPMPEAHDTSQQNLLRYSNYLARAVFYGVTRRTLGAFTGQVMRKPAVIKVPTVLDPVVKDATGTGVSLEQLALRVETDIIALGRAGLLIDYPKTEGFTTRQQQLEGSIRPTITAYRAEAITNWRHRTINGKTMLVLVVLAEEYVEDSDPLAFDYKVAVQYRVIRLWTGYVEVEIWRSIRGEEYTVQPAMSYKPTDATGKFLTEIPFTFVGAKDNEASVDEPPLYDMAELNVAHYVNSAEYEDSVFMVGQPTPWVAGLDKSWVDDVLKGTLALGSRGGVMLPEGGSIGLLETKGNPLAFDGMKHKEEQMKALGAKLIEPISTKGTATEASIDAGDESSVLTVMTNNVSAAFLWALEWAAIFAGGTTINRDAKDKDKNVLNFELNTDFDFGNMSSERVTATLTAWEKEAITFTEMRQSLRNIGIATEDDEDAKKDIRDEVAARGTMTNALDAQNPKFGGAPGDPVVPGNEDDEDL